MDARSDRKVAAIEEAAVPQSADGRYMAHERVRLTQISPLDAFDSYVREARLAPSTVKRFRPVIAAVQKEHAHMSDVTPEWCMEWRDRLRDSGLSSITIKNVHLGCLRSLCRWAVSQGYMSANPVDGIIL